MLFPTESVVSIGVATYRMFKNLSSICDEPYLISFFFQTNTFAIVHNSSNGLFHGEGWFFYAGV